MSAVDRSRANHYGNERGVSLIETVIALAIIGLVAVLFLSGVGVVSRTSGITDQKSTADSLEASQMEWVRSVPYVYGATQYATAAMPTGKDYAYYTVTISAASLRTPDDGIQKITVTTKYNGLTMDRLEGYKVDR